ncbi:MAG: hypothetical protein JW728_07130 [Candidatus Aureabacteria bacterium]|nr:hypothetical protein [Candidatus Auribacterota bacterium]
MKQVFLQFGDSNFIRAFFDSIVHELNKKEPTGSVIVIQPHRSGRVKELQNQSNLYTLVLRGNTKTGCVNKKEIINCISESINPYVDYRNFSELYKRDDIRFIISDDKSDKWHAGSDEEITAKPPENIAGKITAFLFKRFKHFKGSSDKGIILLPCEDVVNNGELLRNAVIKTAKYWCLGDGFLKWLDTSCFFLSTVCDRIVMGFPFGESQHIEKEMGYSDRLIVEAEPFYRWVIKGPKKLARDIPFIKPYLNVLYTDDLSYYCEIKDKVYKETLTFIYLLKTLLNAKNFSEICKDRLYSKFIKNMVFHEILPSVKDVGEKHIRDSENIIERMNNPHIVDEKSFILTNGSVSPGHSFLETARQYMANTGKAPVHLIFSFAMRIYFCSKDKYIKDLISKDVFVRFTNKAWKVVGKSTRGIQLLSRKIIDSRLVWERRDTKDIKVIRRLLQLFIINLTRLGPRKSIERVVLRKKGRK